MCRYVLAELISEFDHFFVKQEVDTEDGRVSVRSWRGQEEGIGKKGSICSRSYPSLSLLSSPLHFPFPPSFFLTPSHSLSHFRSPSFLSPTLVPSLSPLSFHLSQNLTEMMTTALKQLVDNQERMFEQIK